MKLDNFIGMMTGHFDNKEQFDMMQKTGKIQTAFCFLPVRVRPNSSGTVPLPSHKDNCL